MKKAKQRVYFLLGTLFASTIVFYSFFQPFHLGAVCEIMPEQASSVFRSKSLESLLNSPAGRQLDRALGDEFSLKEITGSNGWNAAWAASEIAVARIPSCSGIGESWAAAGWIGWRSPWLRWKLQCSRSQSLEQIGKQAVWPVWRYTPLGTARRTSLTFALTDTLFIASISENPADIVPLLETYDKRRLLRKKGIQK